jgi:hypothetical protein
MTNKIWFFPSRSTLSATTHDTTTTTAAQQRGSSNDGDDANDTGDDDECVFFRHKLTALQLVIGEKACVTEHLRRRPGGSDAGFDACCDSVHANLQRLWYRCATAVKRDD